MNVVFYVVDCLRGDKLSATGYSRETTPRIDELASDGVLYENCYSPATWTRPASVSILSGMYPPAHGVRYREHTVPDSIPWLPTVLQQAGFQTHGISAMGNVSSPLGYSRGFDSFDDLYLDERLIEKRSKVSAEQERLVHEERSRIVLPQAEDISEATIPSLESGKNKFTFCWNIDLHMPLSPPPEYRDFLDSNRGCSIQRSTLHGNPAPKDTQHLRDLYDCELRYVDAEIGRIIDELKARGEYEECLFIILGDHGESQGEHGEYFHGGEAYDERLHVPLILKPPEDIDTERRSELVSLVDVLPTVLSIVGSSIPEPVQGRVLPPFGDEPWPDCRPVFSETQLRSFKPVHYSVRDTERKYMRTDWPPAYAVVRDLLRSYDDLPGLRFSLATIRDSLRTPRRTESLFDVSDSGDSTVDLAEREPDTISQYRKTLDDWLDECSELNERISSTRAEIDGQTTEQLRQLGYTE